MLAQITDACGSNASWLCEIVYNQTGSTITARWTQWLATVLVIVGLAWSASHLVSRRLPQLTTAVSTRREETEIEAGRHDLNEQQQIDFDLRLERSRQRSTTMGHVIASVLRGLIWLIAGFLLLDQIGINLAPLLAGAGVLGIAIGFGAQQLIRDLLAGIFIVFEDQFGVGDVVDLGEATGTVERVNLRVTRLRDVDGIVWFVPNGEIRRVANKSKLWSRAVLDIQVSYDTDIDQAGAVMTQVARDLWREDRKPLTIIDEPEYWGVENFGADGVTLRLVVRTEPTEQWATARELRRRIKMRFDDEGIEIPFPQRTIHLRDERPTLDQSAVSEPTT